MKANKYKTTMKMVAAAMVLLSSSKVLATTFDADLQNVLNDRPTIENRIDGGNPIKMVDTSDTFGSEKLQYQIDSYLTEEIVQSNKLEAMGYTELWKADELRISNDVCLIHYDQSGADLDNEGFYLHASDNAIIASPKHFVDFFIKSHEAGHCSFFYQPKEDGDFAVHMTNSIRELAADLGAVIDYMRVTGTNDLYTDYLKPYRLSAIGYQGHNDYRITWAMDEILEDISPELMQHQEASDIPEFVNILMRKHILTQDGQTYDMNKPATIKMADELNAHMDIVSEKVNRSDIYTINKFKSDVSNSVYNQIIMYKEHMSDEGEFRIYEDNFNIFKNDNSLPEQVSHNIKSGTMLKKSVEKIALLSII